MRQAHLPQTRPPDSSTASTIIEALIVFMCIAISWSCSAQCYLDAGSEFPFRVFFHFDVHRQIHDPAVRFCIDTERPVILYQSPFSHSPSEGTSRLRSRRRS